MASTATASVDTRKIVEEKSLRQILDGIVKAQRQDIKAFSGGHLNEANLPKPPSKGSCKSWKSAKKPAIKLVPKSTIPSSKADTKNQDDMKLTMLSFSMGTSGAVPMKAKPKPTPIGSTPSAGSRSSHKPVGSKKSDKVLIEELTLPEAMLRRTDYYVPDSKLLDTELKEGTHPGEDWNTGVGGIHQRNLPALSSRQFMASHLQAVTKKDQFQHLKQFEHQVIRKQDTMEQNIMSGVKAVEHLEAKLHQELDNLKYNGYGPNFHRLQVYSNVFELLLLESSTFGYQLETIKCEYDNYISSLLDGQASRHKVLHKQVEKLTARGGNQSQVLAQEASNVREMEAEAETLLEQNQRLRLELLEEEELLNKPKEEEVTPRAVSKHSAPDPAAESTETVDSVEGLKAAILDKLDLMTQLKTKLRRDCVPSTVCSHLEQCVKETEVEIQKLTSQKQFFERSIADMETELQSTIEMADTTEKDARRVWKRITAVKNVDQLHQAPGAGVTRTGPGGPTGAANPWDSDGDGDEERKWNWYIS